MINWPVVVIALAVVTTGCSRAVAPHTAGTPVRDDACAPASRLSASLVSYMQDLVTATDAPRDRSREQARQLYQLPRVPPGEVVLVMDPATCARAAVAYTRAMEDTVTSATQRRVHVVRVGNRYVVEDPFTPARAGEFTRSAVFTERWRLIVLLVSSARPLDTEPRCYAVDWPAVLPPLGSRVVTIVLDTTRGTGDVGVSHLDPASVSNAWAVLENGKRTSHLAGYWGEQGRFLLMGPAGAWAGRVWRDSLAGRLQLSAYAQRTAAGRVDSVPGVLALTGSRSLCPTLGPA